MFETKLLSVTKKCSAVILAFFLILGSMTLLVLSGGTVARAEGAGKMIRVTTTNNTSISAYTYKLAAGTTYRVAFKYHFLSSDISKVALNKNNGSNWGTYASLGNAVLTENEYYEASYEFTQDADGGVDIGMTVTGASDFYIYDYTIYDVNDPDKINLFQYDLDKGLTGFRQKNSSNVYSGTTCTLGNCTMAIEDYNSLYFLTPTKKMMHLINTNQQTAIYVKTTLTVNTTYKVSFKYKLNSGAFVSSRNDPGITVRMYDSGFYTSDVSNFNNGSYITTDDSGWYEYVATLIPTKTVGGYLGIYLNNGDKSTTDLYISDFTLYNAEDEEKTNLLSVSSKANDLSGWYERSGGATTALSGIQYVKNGFTLELSEYNDGYFKLPSDKMIQINCSESVAGASYLYPYFGQTVTLTQGKEYTVSYKYRNYNYSLNNGYYFVVGPKTLYATPLISSNNSFIIVESDNSYECKLTFTAPSNYGVDMFVGFYFTLPLKLDIANFVLYETDDETKTNLLTGKPNTNDLSGWRGFDSTVSLSGMTEYVYTGDRGSYTATLAEYDSAAFIKKATGDVNSDNNIDIRDLVRIKKLIAEEKFEFLADLNCDNSLNAMDLNYLRKLLIGVITIDDIVTPAVKPLRLLNGGATEQATVLSNTIDEYEDSLTYTGNAYYVSENGNDDNAGTSASEAFKTISKVNTLSLTSGDAVFFERGSKFRTAEALDVVTGVSYGAYGTGEKPEILGSLTDYAQSGIWMADIVDNLWKLTLSGENEAGAIIFNNNSCGTRRYALSNVTANGDFYHNLENNTLYLYCDRGNPGTYFDSIEISTTPILIDGMPVLGLKRNNVNIQNLSLKYATKLGMDFEYSTGNTVRGCEFAWIGGMSYGAINGENTTRMGNGIQFWASNSGCTVENCLFYQIFDAAVTFQGSVDEAITYSNININNNLIEYCSMNFEFWGSISDKSSSANTTMTNIEFSNNIVRFGGYGWGGMQRYDIDNQAMLLGWNFIYDDGKITNFTIHNNIFDTANCYFIYASNNLIGNITFEGNSYYQGVSTRECSFSKSGSLVNSQQTFESAVETIESEPAGVYWLG